MKKMLALFLLWPSLAFGAQVDYILKFADEATARAALASRLRSDENGVLQWPQEYCIPGIQLWRNSQDVGGTDGQGNAIVTHSYLPGFFILCSLTIVLPALRDNAAVQVVIDRDMAKARQAGAVIKSNVSNAILQDIRIAPLYMGTDLPYGNMQ